MNTKNKELKAFLQGLKPSADADKEARVARAHADFFAFLKTYFSHHINNIETETSAFRRYIHERILQDLQAHSEMLFTAYRGAAKSTLLSKLLPLWLTLTARKHYAVIISSSLDLGIDLLELISIELEFNARLKTDFNVSLTSVKKQELTFKAGEHEVKIKVFGAGKRIRGTTYLSYRPDLIILDDIENDENVVSKIQRDKLENWYKRVVKFLPSLKTEANILIVGTILHYDSLLVRLSKGGVFSKNFPLVLDFERWELDDPSLDKEAIKKEYELDKDAFFQERQNIPISKDKSVFGEYKTYKDLPQGLACYMAIDPSLGKSKSDYFAIALVYKERGRFYAHAQGFKISPQDMIEKIIYFYMKYKPLKIVIETVAFQEFFKDVLKKRASALGIHLPLVEIKPRAAKELRIDSLAPFIKDGSILIDEKCQLLIDELLAYPLSPHDDLLDALEMAFKAANAGKLDYKTVLKKLEKLKAKEEALKKLFDWEL